MSQTLNTLRKQLRSKRRQLSHYEQKKAEQRVLVQLRQFTRFKSASKIGLYLHAFGEVHTDQLLKLCFRQNKQVYLPMICNMNQHLVWVKVSSRQYLNKRFSHHPLGMKEPMASRGKHVSYLDLLIMPLLACDQFGTRIGMGGGYYDRTLASAKHRPYRLGLAHTFQYVDTPLLRQKWDQPLNALLCPKKFYYFMP
ncbi:MULTISPECIES: 5-formyltetrahydrofolate cyclo-ligase [Acinetobacter]|uniref:5-formyltetrahydrofolate cyclo-ligase n=1 Tax=Acinetobacter higginsii TaxID=70347 RepID=N9TES9_9GAMM|nr:MULTISPECIES: 5-formyltetrahydrofolate cyclo-ligase [Acinetobacter]ENX58917.1 5-formyltetrahydrofolate cyclo-ligase [Acinetobacter higginsii]ENX61910.1 5-formyltetrahydrofolate cyclo-ligase [Acinetobacter higginsii]MCH7319338.1 5-formyltetrahydrofolate cyclo-ligase [Acinetobacter higginsii]MCH7380510.1 5-formyltetrahydrofolate cyclo-ligase [Acinetobacter higginsii]MCJ0827395.1 5-formyltetrahydrofolate cyclo-ligase [Acinetobacter sp. NIPH1876]